MLAEFIEDGRDALDTYRIHNDLWVAMRCRALFALALASGPTRAAAGDLTGVTSWVDGQLIPSWTALVRLLRYNAGKVARGRTPRSGAGAALVSIGRHERELRLRLDATLAREEASLPGILASARPAAGEPAADRPYNPVLTGAVEKVAAGDARSAGRHCQPPSAVRPDVGPVRLDVVQAGLPAGLASHAVVASAVA